MSKILCECESAYLLSKPIFPTCTFVSKPIFLFTLYLVEGTHGT